MDLQNCEYRLDSVRSQKPPSLLWAVQQKCKLGPIDGGPKVINVESKSSADMENST